MSPQAERRGLWVTGHGVVEFVLYHGHRGGPIVIQTPVIEETPGSCISQKYIESRDCNFYSGAEL
jgi:hypothetical protein